MKALVIGSSGGIGQALTTQLRANAQFESVATLSRSEDGLDVKNEASVIAAARRLEAEYRQFDLIMNAVGALEIAVDQLAVAARLGGESLDIEARKAVAQQDALSRLDDGGLGGATVAQAGGTGYRRFGHAESIGRAA